MSVKKKALNVLTIGVCVFALLLLGSLTKADIQANPVRADLRVNAQPISFVAFNINDITYFKLRDLAELLSGSEKQFNVDWDDRDDTIIIVTQTPYLAFGDALAADGDDVPQTAVPNRSTLSIDGEKLEIDAYNIKGNNYFQLRDIGKALNFSVEWDSATNTIDINTAGDYHENSADAITAGKMLTFAESFESSRLSSSWGKEYAATGHAPQITDNYAAAGIKSLRVELRSSDPMIANSKRAEITLRREKPLEEHWYAFSIYLPNGGAEDYAKDPKSSEILVQWHNVPDAGEEWTSPPLSLHTENGNWKIQRWWDDAVLTSNQQMLSKKFYANHYLGSYAADKGKWTNWIFHVRWGWKASQSPILEVYKNGILVLEENGKPNTTNDQNGVYMKLGIYKWEWMRDPTPSVLSKRVVYLDNIRIYQP